MNENELMHYGVKGMKWGVRRARPQTARQTYRAAKKKAKNIAKVNTAAILAICGAMVIKSGR